MTPRRFLLTHLRNAVLTLAALAATPAMAAQAAAQAPETDEQSDTENKLESREPRETSSPAPAAVSDALQRAGDNRDEIQAALDKAPAEQADAMKFLIANMPVRDLRSLSSQFLLDNSALAHQAWKQAPWADSIPRPIFLNNILPYANINESRDRWRKEFRERFLPLVAEAKTASEAAAILNRKIFPMLNVKYSTKRRRADQGPRESMESGLASCTGLSILLIDACRAVGVPARFVGTPLWADRSGNHSWVEVWDDGWRFTGAAEPTGSELDKAWFLGRAAQARRDHPLHAIYAVSYRRTPQPFPMVWAPDVRDVYAVNVTDRYTSAAKRLPEGWARIMFRAFGPRGDRCAASLRVTTEAGELVFDGKTNDERFDRNDHVAAELKLGENYRVEFARNGQTVRQVIEPSREGELVSVDLPAASSADGEPSAAALRELEAYLRIAPDRRPALAEQSFARTALTKADAQQAEEILWKDHAKRIRSQRDQEMKARRIQLGDLEMKFDYRVFGKKPENGRSLFLSMHGGGGAPKKVNDSQWENQKRLYQPEEGVYLAPRAPTDTWNLWHQAHIDEFFDRLIENLIVFEDVDPNRVYLMGYSAGGDGVYQLAPRMADRFAAASMMAGHPNETSPRGLRNLPFSLHVGERDAAYKRNQVARQWADKLGKLRSEDPDGYEHWAKIYPGKGHWMDREDAAAVGWMSEFDRQPWPRRIVWKQDDVRHRRFYWLALPERETKAGAPRGEIVASRDGQRFTIETDDVSAVRLRLHDDFVDLDQPIEVRTHGRTVFQGRAVRSIEQLARSLDQRGDPETVCSAQVEIRVSAPEENDASPADTSPADASPEESGAGPDDGS